MIDRAEATTAVDASATQAPVSSGDAAATGRRHAGDRRQCPTCKRWFRRTALSRHRQRRHPEIRYPPSRSRGRWSSETGCSHKRSPARSAIRRSPWGPHSSPLPTTERQNAAGAILCAPRQRRLWRRTHKHKTPQGSGSQPSPLPQLSPPPTPAPLPVTPPRHRRQAATRSSPANDSSTSGSSGPGGRQDHRLGTRVGERRRRARDASSGMTSSVVRRAPPSEGPQRSRTATSRRTTSPSTVTSGSGAARWPRRGWSRSGRPSEHSRRAETRDRPTNKSRNLRSDLDGESRGVARDPARTSSVLRPRRGRVRRQRRLGPGGGSAVIREDARGGPRRPTGTGVGHKTRPARPLGRVEFSTSSTPPTSSTYGSWSSTSTSTRRPPSAAWSERSWRRWPSSKPI